MQKEVPCPRKSLITNGRYFYFFVTGFFGGGKKGKIRLPDGLTAGFTSVELTEL